MVTSVRGGKAKWVLIAAIAVVLTPFLILLLRLPHGPTYATSDLALIELRTRDVGTRHTPLVGVYSRYHWNHPGPLLFYALALPYRLLGSSVRSLIAGGVLLNAASAAGAVALFWRRGRVAGAALGTIAVLILLRSLGGAFLQYPWNPYATVLPLFVLALLAWSVACRDHWMFPVAILVASFVVQAHIGTTLAAATLMLFAAIALAFDARRRQAPHLGRVLLVSATVAVLAWIPPVVDQLTGGGNLADLWRYWTKSHSPTVGYTDAAKLMSSQLSVPAPWLTGHETINPFSGGVTSGWHFPFALVLLVAAAVVAWRRRDRTSFALTAVALAFDAAAFVSIARIIDQPYTYIIRWTWGAGVLTWLAIGWTTIALLATRATPDVRRAAAAVAVITTAALLIPASLSALHGNYPDPGLERATEVIEPVVRHLVEGRAAQPVLIQTQGGIDAGAMSSALLLDLKKRGINARFDRLIEYIAGADNSIDPARAKTRLLVATDAEIPKAAGEPGIRKIAEYDQLSPDDRAFLNNLESVLSGLDFPAQQRYLAMHIDDAKRYQDLAPNSLHVAVFERATSPSGGTT
jgi:hypothetical protein